MNGFIRQMLLAAGACCIGLAYGAPALDASSDALSASASGAKPITGSATIADGDKTLTLKQAMAHPDWLGRQPEGGFWAPHSDAILYRRKQEGSELRDLIRRSLDGRGNGSPVPIADYHSADHSRAVYNSDGTRMLYVSAGDIFLYDLTARALKQITRSSTRESAPVFLNDGRIGYRLADSWFAFDETTGLASELISLRFGKEPDRIKEPESYIAQEQLKLMDYTQLQLKNRRDAEARRQALLTHNIHRTRDPIYFPKGMAVRYAALSPTGRHLLLAITKRVKRNKADTMMRWINDDAGLKPVQVRARVADHKPYEELLKLIDIASGEVIDLSVADLPGLTDDPLAAVRAENMDRDGKTYEAPEKPKARKLHLLFGSAPIQWHSRGRAAAIMLESYDNKDRWLATVTTDAVADARKATEVQSPDAAKAETLSVKLVSQHRLSDAAWIGYTFNQFGWFHEAETLYYLSEESGYSQLYEKPIDGPIQPLTEGRFEVNAVTLTRDDSAFYFRANIDHPGIYEVYRVSSQGGTLAVLTDLDGMINYRLSPDEEKLLLTHSTLAQPPELYVQNAQPDQRPQRITQTISKAFQDLKLITPKIVPVPSSHGEAPIYARVYWPTDFKLGETGSSRRAVIFNHGAGYLQNSHYGWSGYFREFLFHTILAQEGIVVMDMDYRASRGYGRDWRTAIYRRMGTPEVEDLEDGVRWLAANANVDTKRVGTYGGSYGGFMTFMAMFQKPDLFKAGAALRPVTDWAHYNTGYTSNILNYPDIDPIAYERSSPIYFAEGLKGELLINAPMVDDNVFFQDTVRLVQRLIELEKENWETAIYPVEPHGFRQPSSWLDEYRRIYKLFKEELD